MYATELNDMLGLSVSDAERTQQKATPYFFGVAYCDFAVMNGNLDERHPDSPKTLDVCLD